MKASMGERSQESSRSYPDGILFTGQKQRNQEREPQRLANKLRKPTGERKATKQTGGPKGLKQTPRDEGGATVGDAPLHFKRFQLGGRRDRRGTKTPGPAREQDFKERRITRESDRAKGKVKTGDETPVKMQGDRRGRVGEGKKKRGPARQATPKRRVIRGKEGQGGGEWTKKKGGRDRGRGHFTRPLRSRKNTQDERERFS